MKNIILLDLDGVLITTPPWRPDKMHDDGYSDFNMECVAHLNQLSRTVEANWWLSSTRRAGKTEEEFRTIFSNRQLNIELKGFLPIQETLTMRKTEVDQFLDKMRPKNYLIIDDDSSLNGLENSRKQQWIRTDPLIGFNNSTLELALEKANRW